jgi:dethiobiotin synthetase
MPTLRVLASIDAERDSVSRPVRGLFITGTGTGVGKTTVACALAQALIHRGHLVRAIKPIETGCDPFPRDARALADASSQAEVDLVGAPGFYRAQPPLAPRAVALGGGPTVDLDRITTAVRSLATPSALLLVEGAGGFLVPLDRTRTLADLAVALALPLVLVAPDFLGVLSDTLTTLEAAAARHLTVAAVVLGGPERDQSSETNAAILRERIDSPVIPFPCVPTNEATADRAPADALQQAARVLAAALEPYFGSS